MEAPPVPLRFYDRRVPSTCDDPNCSNHTRERLQADWVCTEEEQKFDDWINKSIDTRSPVVMAGDVGIMDDVIDRPPPPHPGMVAQGRNRWVSVPMPSWIEERGLFRRRDLINGHMVVWAPDLIRSTELRIGDAVVHKFDSPQDEQATDAER